MFSVSLSVCNQPSPPPMAEEFLLCMRKVGLSQHEVVQLTLQALDAAFAPADRLTVLRERIEDYAK